MDNTSQRLLLAGASDDTINPATVFDAGGYLGGTNVNVSTLDLSNNDGLVIIKHTNGGGTRSWYVRDTDSGSAYFSFDSTGNSSDTGFSFTSTGFTTGSLPETSRSGEDYKYATLLKTPGFFDIVRYTGNGSSQQINHNLGVVPKMMWIKRTNNAAPCVVYMDVPDLNDDGYNADDYFLRTDSTNEATLNPNYWTSPTSTQFQVLPSVNVNGSGDSYVAYLFAEVAGLSAIGSYTGNGTSQTITTGFRPRYLFIKPISNNNREWHVHWDGDPITSGFQGQYVKMDSNDQETSTTFMTQNSTGFTVSSGDSQYNRSPDEYVYFALGYD